jgi:hypothetical protein
MDRPQQNHPHLTFLNLTFSLVLYSNPPLPKKNVRGVYTKLLPSSATNQQAVIFIYRIFRPIAHALSIQKRSEIVKNEHAWYTLERFLTDNARVICTKKGIGKYGIMYYT